MNKFKILTISAGSDHTYREWNGKEYADFRTVRAKVDSLTRYYGCDVRDFIIFNING